ncbi:hypothetical protein [Listeria monocytogenes]|uniref:hypothetical protein n=1 Tax=Listeria monocytogenes TaxID=1639 RepID=UPI0008750435|nr:hypothetical protein [Listeria monocytogenes]OFG14535.1 hypothetical protein BJM43_07770 [Listeria monocytogenes]
MENKFDPKIIKQCRNTINGNNNFIRLHFVEYSTTSDKEKKNLWSKICSCMDWIEVALAGLQEYPQFSKNQNKSSLEFSQFILTIDMLTEAIRNLWLTFSSTNIEEFPLKNKRNVFNGNTWGKPVNDDIYFKHIRAFFAMHSVNGNEVSINIDGKKIKVRFFSSWSTKFSEHEFRLRLYSNNNEAERQYGLLKISIQELLEYAYNYYSTLIKLNSEIEEFYISVIEESISKNQISLNENLSPLEKMLRLKKFSEETTYMREYYTQDIDWYIKMLYINQNKFNIKDKEIIQKFLSELEKKVIPAYTNALNSIQAKNSKDIELISISPKNELIHTYEYSKILEYCEYSSEDTNNTRLEGSSGIKDICLSILIENKELPEYATSLSNEELYLLIHAKTFHDNNSD